MRSAVAVVGRRASGADPAERPLDLRVPDRREALERGLAGGDGGQALLDVAAVGLDVQVGQGLDHRPLGVAQVAQGDEVVGQGSRLVAGPGVEGGDELGRLDQAVLQREQAEQEVAFGGHGASSSGARGQPGDSHRGSRPVVVRSGGLIVMREGARTPVHASGGGLDRFSRRQNFSRMGSRCLPPRPAMLGSPRYRRIGSRRSYHGHQDAVRKAHTVRGGFEVRSYRPRGEGRF